MPAPAMPAGKPMLGTAPTIPAPQAAPQKLDPRYMKKGGTVKSKRYAAGGEADDEAKKGAFSGKAAEDDSDTYAPKTRSFSETGPDKPKAKAKEPKASQDDAFPKKDREKDDKPELKGSQNFPLTPRAKEKEKEKDPDYATGKKKIDDTPGKKYGIGPHGAFGDVERFFEKNFKSPAQRRDEQKAPKKMAKGGSASSRGDGIAQRGKTKGRMI
jgi:hypothetical protein